MSGEVAARLRAAGEGPFLILRPARKYLARYFTGEAASSRSDEAVRVLQSRLSPPRALRNIVASCDAHCVITSGCRPFFVSSRAKAAGVEGPRLPRCTPRLSFDAKQFASSDFLLLPTRAQIVASRASAATRLLTAARYENL
jgi:hypothetical protein